MPESTRKPRAPKRAAVTRPVRRTSDAHASTWHRIGRGALFVVAGVLPWFFLPLTMAPVATARLLLAAVAATVGLVALLADTVERRRLTYPGSLAALGVLAVVVATAIAAIFSQSMGVSLFGGLILPDSLAHVIIAALLFVLAAVFITERTHYVRLATAFVGGAGLASLLAILGFVGVPYLAGFAPGSISQLGFIAVLALGMVCLAPISALPSRAQAFLLGSGVLSLAALVLMNFRILWIGVALIALFTAAAGFVRKASISLPLALSLIALVFVLVGPHLPSFVVGNIELRPGTALTVSAMRETFSGSQAIVGSGPGTFAYTYAENRPAEVNESPFWNARFDQGVSYLATVPVTTGILGSLAWLMLLVGGALLLRRRLSDPAAPYALLAVALSGFSLLVYPGSFSQLVIGGIALGVLVGIAGERRSLAFPDRSSWPLFATFLALIVVTAASLAGLYLVGQRYVAAAYFAAGGQAIAEERVADGIAHVERAVALDGDSDVYQRGLSQALLVQVRQMASTSTTDQRQLQATLTRAIETANRATALNPADAENWANLGGIFEGLTPYLDGMDAQAIAAYDEAATRDPQSPVWPLARARTYAALVQFKGAPFSSDILGQAQAELEKALALKADYAEARFLSVQLYLAAGDADRALARANEIRQQSPDNADLAYQLGLLFYQQGRATDARQDLERAVSLSPGFANARYFLGLTYSQLGMRDEALAQFRQIQQANPENEEIPVIIGNLTNGRDVLEGIGGQPQVPAATTTTETE